MPRSDIGADALSRLGGQGGAEIWEAASIADREVRNLLDSVLPVSIEGIGGHGGLYSLRALGGADLLIDSEGMDAAPFVLLDDGQDLASMQRDALLDALTDRDLTIPRWYTERYSALAPGEVVGDGEPGRGYIPLHLERATREMGGQVRRGRRVRPFESMLLDVADRRAQKPLVEYGDETETGFSEFLEVEDHDLLSDGQEADVVSVLRQRVVALAGGRQRYDEWLHKAEELAGYQAALRWRELEIVIARDRDRKQLELLDLRLAEDELREHSDAAIREAAALFLRKEFRIPYYFGPQRLARLASQNIEQFLNLSGNMFEEMLALITLRRRPWLSAVNQDRIVRRTSDRLWASIPQRRAYGRDIQHLLLRVATIAQRETYRPKASYAPGVTGVALSMRDRARILDPSVRARIAGGDELFRSLAGAIGHNFLAAELDRAVKGDRWMVMYLNRLLCARFDLPVGYGGFRHVTLEELGEWMTEPPDSDLAGETTEPLFAAR